MQGLSYLSPFVVWRLNNKGLANHHDHDSNSDPIIMHTEKLHLLQGDGGKHGKSVERKEKLSWHTICVYIGTHMSGWERLKETYLSVYGKASANFT